MKNHHTQGFFAALAEGPPSPDDMCQLFNALIWDGDHARAEVLAETMQVHMYSGLQPDHMFYMWLARKSTLHNVLRSNEARARDLRDARTAARNKSRCP